MKDKIVVITGASSGLGLATARALAIQGAHLVLVGRDPARTEAAADSVARVARATPVVRLADLSSQQAIRALAQDLSTSLPRIDVLINNAGGVFTDRTLTVDGIEATLATNYLAPFLLTRLLLDCLRKSPASRVVNVVSKLHSASSDVLGNLQGERKYNFMSAYKTSKFALISFTYELARHLAGSRVTVNCVEPGPSKTRFGDNLTGAARLFPLIMKKLPLFRPASKGAAAIAQLASSGDLEAFTGGYFNGLRPVRSSPITRDERLAADLWILSSRLVGLAPEFEARTPRPVAVPSRAGATAGSAP